MVGNLILGTAGHIDHGKSSLIRALTGIDPDRLPEEKRRGITIELGYAHLDLGEWRLGIVDVPGHEKFIRQMLAGATGIDLVLLVIAADDSIKPQTREHLDILRLLEIRGGVIALTKADLVDSDWLELVSDEIREFVRGTFLENAPIIPVSSKTGVGLSELKAAILQLANSWETRTSQGPFRMAIDRCFPREGFGAVVTGSVSCGQVQVGDVLELQPGGLSVRVRGLQNHDQGVGQVQCGQRAAVNLSGLHHDQIQRGAELASPGYLRPTRELVIELQALPDLKRPIRDRTRVHVHLGTTEIPGNLRLPPEVTELVPGERSVARLYLAEDAVATWGQPCVVRWESPVVTLGGGRVLFPGAVGTSKLSSAEWRALQQMTSPQADERLEAALYLAGPRTIATAELQRWTGENQVAERLDALQKAGRIVPIELGSDRQILVHPRRLAELQVRLTTYLRQLHERHPLRLGHPLLEIYQRFSYLEDVAIIKHVIRLGIQDKSLVSLDKLLAVAGCGPQLTKAERALYAEMLVFFQRSGLVTPTVAEYAKTVAKSRDSVPLLVKLAVDSGFLLSLSPDWLVHRDVWGAAWETIRKGFAHHPGWTVAEIRDLLGISRKQAVPLCEYLDQHGLTLRNGDLRRLRDYSGAPVGPSLSHPIDSAE